MANSIRLMTRLSDMSTYLEVDGAEIPPENPLHASYLIEYNKALLDRFKKYCDLLESDNRNLQSNPDFTLNYLSEMDKKNKEFNGGR